MNVQYAVKGSTIYILELNPRASRTVPFVSKATGVPWAKVAAKCMAGISLKEQGITHAPIPNINWLMEVGARSGKPRKPVFQINSIYAIFRAAESSATIGSTFEPIRSAWMCG